MARNYMRNKASGEIRDVEADSEEFRDLQKEVTSLGQPMWEQTNIAHASAIAERAEAGELFDEDLGFEDQDALRYEALNLAAEGVAPEQNPHLFLTPGEIEAGLTPEQKQKDLADMYAQKSGRASKIYRQAAERIHGGSVSPPDEVPALAGQHSALAGGSDDREDAPSRGAFVTDTGGESKGQVQPSSSKTGGGGARPSAAQQQAAGDGKEGKEGKGSESSGGGS